MAIKTLGSYFNAHKRREEEQRLYRRLMAQLFEAVLLDQKEEAIKIIPAISAMQQFNEYARSTVMITAISKDNVSVFDALQKAIWQDVNKHVVTLHSRPNMKMRNERHLLYCAIAKGAPEIALFLADDNSVKINESGKRVFIKKKDRQRVIHYTSPLDAAEDGQMNAVVAVIAERISEDYAKRARAARAKAFGLGLGS